MVLVDGAKKRCSQQYKLIFETFVHFLQYFMFLRVFVFCVRVHVTFLSLVQHSELLKVTWTVGLVTNRSCYLRVALNQRYQATQLTLIELNDQTTLFRL